MTMSALTLSSVDEQIKLLSSAPQILPKLQQLISDANTNPDDILDLIRLDPALAARVIMTSNTAFFSPGFRVNNIEDAVTYLGYDEVYRIITLLAFARLMRSPLRHYGLDAGALWSRALACAISMDSLGSTLTRDRRLPYTIGLLHGIGMVFVDRQLVASKVPPPAITPPEDEVRLMGVTHAEVGAYVLRQWNFPEEIIEPVRSQFEPLDCQSQRPLACLLHVARTITQNVIHPPREGERLREPDPLVLTMLNLPLDEFHEVLQEAEGKFRMLEVATSDF